MTISEVLKELGYNFEIEGVSHVIKAICFTSSDIINLRDKFREEDISAGIVMAAYDYEIKLFIKPFSK